MWSLYSDMNLLNLNLKKMYFYLYEFQKIKQRHLLKYYSYVSRDFPTLLDVLRQIFKNIVMIFFRNITINLNAFLNIYEIHLLE